MSTTCDQPKYLSMIHGHNVLKYATKQPECPMQYIWIDRVKTMATENRVHEKSA